MNEENRLPELDRDAILTSDDIVTEYVEVPEWGGGVHVRGLTGRERDAYESSLLDQKGRSTKANLQNARSKLVVMSTVDAKGTRLFTEGDILELSSKSAAALDRIWKKARSLSGMTDEDLEELTLGLDDAQSEPSTSD